MPTNETRAVEAVRARMIELGDWSAAKLIEVTGLAEGTVRDFLSGRRWPRDATLAAIEEAIGWPNASIAGIAEGEDVPVVPRMEDSSRRSSASPSGVHSVWGPGELDSIVVVMPDGWREGLSDLEAAEIETAVKLEALRLARELKASRARREAAPQ